MRVKRAFVAVLLIANGLAAQQPAVKTVHADDVSRVEMAPLKISGAKDDYHSVHIALYYRYARHKPEEPGEIDFLIQTVTKKRLLNPDLYIVFVVDGERVFLSSNRRAVRNPVPGRRFIGERIEMRMPLSMLQKIVEAESSAIQMGKTTFVIGPSQKAAIKDFLNFSPS